MVKGTHSNHAWSFAGDAKGNNGGIRPKAKMVNDIVSMGESILEKIPSEE